MEGDLVKFITNAPLERLLVVYLAWMHWQQRKEMRALIASLSLLARSADRDDLDPARTALENMTPPNAPKRIKE